MTDHDLAIAVPAWPDAGQHCHLPDRREQRRGRRSRPPSVIWLI